MDNDFLITIGLLRLFTAVFFIAVGSFVLFANFIIFVNNIIPGRKWSSAVPFFGGIFLAFGILVIPFSLIIKYFWWVAFLLDYTLPQFIYFLFFTEEGKDFRNQIKSKDK